MDEDPQQSREPEPALAEAIFSTSRAAPAHTVAGALLAVFVGGAVGTVSRYLFEAHHPITSGDFPG